MKVGGLGNFLFTVSDEEVRTWSQRSWNHSDRYQTMDVIKAGQILVFGGRNLATGQLTVSLHPDYANAAEAIAELEKLRGRAVRLTLGGRLYPKPYVLENYTETENNLGVVELSLNLREYNVRVPNPIS